MERNENDWLTVGDFLLTEPVEMTYAGYECAAWSKTHKLSPGRYPVRILREDIKRGTPRVYVRIPSVIVSDYFASGFAGTFLKYDVYQNTGKPDSYGYSMYAYEFARLVATTGEAPLDGKIMAKIQLDPGFSVLIRCHAERPEWVKREGRDRFQTWTLVTPDGEA